MSPRDSNVSESTHVDVVARLASAKAKVAAGLSVAVKRELHQSRSKHKKFSVHERKVKQNDFLLLRGQVVALGESRESQRTGSSQEIPAQLQYSNLEVRNVGGFWVFYPRASFTPGLLYERTVDLICSSDFSTREVRHDTAKMKAEVYRAYGLDKNADLCPCEVDHWPALEDLGADGSEVDLDQITVNLWPQSFQTEVGGFKMLGAREKDRVETWVHKQLCSGQITSDQIPIALYHWP